MLLLQVKIYFPHQNSWGIRTNDKSADINKIVRMDYANDTLYMHLTIEAIGLWKQWNQERAELNQDPVYHETGVLLFSGKDNFSDFEKNCMKTIRESGYGHFIEEFTSPEQITRKFPQFESAVKNGFNTAYFNKAGGNVYCMCATTTSHCITINYI